MNWLVALSRNADLPEIKNVIESIGGQLDSTFPSSGIISGDELIISVRAPDDFAEAIKKERRKDVVEVYPNSDVMLY